MSGSGRNRICDRCGGRRSDWRFRRTSLRSEGSHGGFRLGIADRWDYSRCGAGSTTRSTAASAFAAATGGTASGLTGRRGSRGRSIRVRNAGRLCGGSVWPGRELKIGLGFGSRTFDWLSLNRLGIRNRCGRLFTQIGFKIFRLQRLRAFCARLFL